VNEFVDNSLDAGATRVVVDIREYIDDGHSSIHKILISDNAASGVIDVRGIFSWTFERKRGKKEIGEFGTGLKSASVNIADKLTILTIRNGKDYLQAVADWHEMSTDNVWTPKILKINKEFLMNYHPFPTGTTIMLENIRHDFIQQQQNDSIQDNLFEQLSWSYKYFLRENPHVSLIVKSPHSSYELSQQIPSPPMVYFFDHCLWSMETRVHVVKQHRSFLVFLQRHDCPYWEQIEFVEKRKNGNHVLKAVQVAPYTDKVFATLLFRSGTYYDPNSTLPLSYGNVDVVRNHRVLVKNTTYRMPRSDPAVAYIKHELFYDNKSLNNMMGVQFNKINNGYMSNGSMKYALEYIQKQHEKELIRFEKNKLDRVISREKDEDDYFCLTETETRKTTANNGNMKQEPERNNNNTTTEGHAAPFLLVDLKKLEPTTTTITEKQKQETEPTTTTESMTEQQRRKNFSMETKLEVIKQQECRDCEFDFRLLDDVLPIDFDHINGQPSNNSKENCQALSVVSHALKTRRPHIFEKHRQNPVRYIVELLNCITSSAYFIDAYVSNKIGVNDEKVLVLRKGLFSYEDDDGSASV
jgi:hypothetical protein